MPVTLESLTSGEPIQANVSELEAELSALWRSAAEGSEAVTRSCALSLLVYTESEMAAREASSLIGDLTLQNPCRAVIMVAEREAKPPGLRAWISAHCHLPAGGGKQVCCEEITIAARGNAVEELSSVVLPLTVPGLPVVLWWRAGDFSPGKNFDQILRVTNRVLVDSARFRDPAADIAKLTSQVRSLKHKFTDLNWARLTPWRELIAQCFDSTERRPYLNRLSDVRIEYEERSPRRVAQQVQALLLAGWLASRLNWSLASSLAAGDGAGWNFQFKAAGHPVRAHCGARRYEEGGKGVCFSIAMKTADVPPATFSLDRGCDGKVVTTRAEIPGRPAVGRSMRLEVPGEVELVNEELKFSGRDKVYEETIEMLASMAGAK